MTGSHRLIRTIYLESLDPVRYTGRDDSLERRIHATIELMVALLLGQRIVISEPVSFDSIGFLEIGRDLLLSCTRENRLERRFLPFRLAVRRYRSGHRNYRHLVASWLRNLAYPLSGWPEISSHRRAREELSTLIAQGKFNECRIRFPAVEDRIESLEIFDHYFGEQATFDARIPSITLDKFAQRALRLAASDSYETEDLRRLRNGLIALRRAGVPISDRSRIRHFGEQVIDRPTHDAIVEFLDSCYNLVVAKSSRAEAVVFTSGGRTVDDLIDSSSLFPHFTSFLDVAYPITTLHLVISRILNQGQPERSLPGWDEIVRIIASPDWSLSIKRLITAHRHVHKSGETDDLREAIVDHVELIGRQINGLLISSVGDEIEISTPDSGWHLGTPHPHPHVIKFWLRLPHSSIGLQKPVLEKRTSTPGADWIARGVVQRLL